MEPREARGGYRGGSIVPNHCGGAAMMTSSWVAVFGSRSLVIVPSRRSLWALAVLALATATAKAPPN